MMRDDLQDARILIVDDDEDASFLVRKLLKHAGFKDVYSTSDPHTAVDMCLGLNADLVLLDWIMPGKDGHEILQDLRSQPSPHSEIPVIVVTSDSRRTSRHKALQWGASDFLCKPLDDAEVVLRIRNILQTRYAHLELERIKNDFEDRLRDRTRDLIHTQMEIIDRLGAAADMRDAQNGEHQKRVAELAASIAEGIGLPQAEISLIRRAAPLHDIGKIAVPDSILLKAGKLTPDEFEVVKKHTTTGACILMGSDIPLLQTAEEIALNHHERWDGLGYPHGLKGIEIPLAGRIVAVADVFDALLSDRPYKKAWTLSQAVSAIEEGKGTQFDPQIVDVFLEIVKSELSRETDTLSPIYNVNAESSSVRHAHAYP